LSLAQLSLLSYPCRHVLAVLSSLLCPIDLSKLISPSWPVRPTYLSWSVRAILSHCHTLLSWLSCHGHHVPGCSAACAGCYVLSALSSLPVLPLASWLSFLAALSRLNKLSCSSCRFKTVLPCSLVPSYFVPAVLAWLSCLVPTVCFIPDVLS
jgi:hypothetical protein